MSQKPNISTFDIRKLSLFKIDKTKENNCTNSLAASEWFHFPQRSDITINFFKYPTDESSFHISIIWKGNVLDQTYWHQGTNNFISAIGKYPSLGFKVVTPKGELLKRFQISFNTKNVYDSCCKCVEEKLKVTLNQMDAIAIGQNSQIIDYPSQNMAAALQNPNLVIRPWENASNTKGCYQPAQALCRPQYNPLLKHNTSFSQLEESTGLINITPEQQNQLQLNALQHIRGRSQLHNNYFLPQYYQPEACYAQYQSPYTYSQTKTQQNIFNTDVLAQEQSRDLEIPSVDYDREKLSLSNTKALTTVDQNNQMLNNGIGNQDHITNESLGINQNDTNMKRKPQNKINNRIPLCESDVNRNKSVIKEEEVLPMEIGKKLDLPKSSTNLIQKSSKMKKSNSKCDLFKMKDSELKRLVSQKLKDQEFVKFVERLDRMVSQP